MFLVILVAVTRTVPFSAMSAFLIEVIRLAIVSLPMTNEFLGIPGLDIKGMFDLLRGICLRCNELIHVPFDELSVSRRFLQDLSVLIRLREPMKLFS
jgi:hypothetical protein